MWNTLQERRFYGGLGILYAADNLWRTVLLWHMLSFRPAPYWLALAAIADAAPTILVGMTGPWWGHKGALSRWIVVQSFLLIAVALLSHRAWLWIGIAVLHGWYSARIIPIVQTTMMRSVPPRKMSEASSRYELASRTGIVIGPILGGLLITRFGLLPALGIGAILSLTTAATWSRMTVLPLDHRSPTPRRIVLGLIHEHQFLKIGFSIRAIANLVWPAFTLGIPLLTRDIWHTQAIGYGLFRSVWAISTVLGTILLIPIFRSRLASGYFVSWIVTGLGFFAIGLSPNTGWALSMTVVAAIGSPIIHVALDTYIGQNIPSPSQAQMFSIQRLITNALNIIGTWGVAWCLIRISPAHVLEGAGLFMASATLMGMIQWQSHDKLAKQYIDS